MRGKSGCREKWALGRSCYEPDRFFARWQKPKHWFGRCNHEWLLTTNPASDPHTWKQHSTTGDTLNLSEWSGKPGAMYGTAVHVHAEAHVGGFLWAGVMCEAADTRYRVGQFQCGITLHPGDNLLVFRVEELAGPALLSALITGPNNEGDTAGGIRCTATV